MNSALLTGLLGIGTSVVAELISYASKKLQGTPLAGSAAFLVAAFIALVGAAVKVIVSGGQGSITADFVQVFTVSEVYFNLVAQNLNLTVSPNSSTPPTPPAA